jgi:deazaflavin-dependent oxidoreductase (nitroreductase family)
MTAARTLTRAPAVVRHSNALTGALLRLGLPMGPNVLMTVRGRTSGEPRTAPVAVPEIDGRRYVIGAYGDVNWVRNLRAAGEADLHGHGRTEHVRATELDQAQATRFFGETLPGFIRRLPWFGRGFARFLFGLVGPEVLADPARAAATRPVFEIRRAEVGPSDPA